MPLKFYNSVSQKKEEFVPLEQGKVRMYVCGVTVYDECHLGHARAAVVFDVVFRYLKSQGYDVTYIRNFTDVDDKIIKKSQESGEAWKSLTQRYIKSYKDVMGRLGVQDPTHEPLATEHIPQMLDLIARLEDKGLAYKGGDDVFYSVRKFQGYGKLSHKRIDDLEIGARVEVNVQKEDPLDFVLWKAAKPGEPQWDSKWGAGRPGWHIECSAMSMEYLGESFDIHGGGRDLIFPHHENEIAQSEGASEKPFAKYWIHNGFVNINAEKMSKSLGNIRSIPAILEQWDPEVVRYFLLSSQYGSPLDFTDKAMEDARAALDRFYEALGRLKKSEVGSEKLDVNFEQALIEGMNDDFNTPYVFGKLFEAVREINKQLDSGVRFSEEAKNKIFAQLDKVHEVLGVFGSEHEDVEITDEKIKEIIDLRAVARHNKDWAKSDEFRDKLMALGVNVKDQTGKPSVYSFASRKLKSG